MAVELELLEVKKVARARQSIVWTILAIILTLGTFIFFYTTTIVRSELPIDQVNINTAQLDSLLAFRVPVYIDAPTHLAHFLPQVQKSLDETISSRYPSSLWSLELKHGAGSPTDYVVTYDYSDTASYAVDSRKINLRLDKNKGPLEIKDFLIAVLLQLFGSELNDFSNLSAPTSNLILPYSSNYNIVFSLFTESGKTISWDIIESLNLITPILNNLNHFSNFSISSQIQYYSTLADDLFSKDGDKLIIKEADLTTFINFGDWNLFNHDINPTINFILYFPKANYDNIPSIIENSKTNSFLVPQWGGVHILNKNEKDLTKTILTKDDLKPSLEIFISQLYQLIGMPSEPKADLFRIDHLSRVTTYKNLKKALDNLNSLIKLTISLNEISIPESTRDHVVSSLQYINETIISLEQQDFLQATQLSAKALFDSNEAFFEKEMVQQAYFPSEHKLAVFLPLLGPVCTVCFIGVVKMLKGKKAEKNKLKLS